MSNTKSAFANFFESLKALIRKIFFGNKAKRNILVLTLFICAFVFVYYKYFSNDTVVSYEYTKVAVKDIQKSVEGSGKVVSLQELDIQQLQSGGKVTAVYVKPGDFVKQGQIIARLDDRQAAIQLSQTKSSYEKTLNGATKEALDIAKQAVTNAKTSYDLAKKQQDLSVQNAKRNLLNNNLSARSLYDDKITTSIPILSGSYICDEETEYKISLNSNSFAGISGGYNGTVNISSVPQKIGDCGLYISFPSTSSWSLGEWVISVPNKLSTSYLSNLNSYNSAIQSREQALINAQTAIVNAELSLNQTVVGARPEDLASARASLASANLSYENTIVRAPFDGQIGSVSAAVGQQTNSQQGIATIITKDKIAEISLNEIDIVNVKLGQQVDLKFDAIPGETFKGSISQIDTIGINTSNVVSFAVKISIPNADERIKSGMSVTANIITEKREKVLSLPSATVKIEKFKAESKNYVLLKNEIENKKIYVEVGMNNDIDVEIVSGLQEGDEIVSKTINANVTAAKATSIFSLFAPQRGTANAGGTRATGSGGNFAR